MSLQQRNARLTLAGRFLARETIDTTVSSFGTDVVELEIPQGLEALRLAWVEFDLPSGHRIRPLIEVSPIQGVGVVTGRIRHLSEQDRAALEGAVTAP